MDEESREQEKGGDHKVSSQPKGRDHLELRWDMTPLSCQGGFLFPLRTQYEDDHAILSFFAKSPTEISAFNPVVGFRVTHTT